MLQRMSLCSLFGPVTGCAIGITLLLQTTVACGHHRHNHYHYGNSNGTLPNYVGGNLGYGAQANSAAARTLRQAYRLLSSSSESYQGHRVQAMRSIKAAARLLGARLGGNGSAHLQQTSQLQGNSDARLRRAEGMLEQVRNSATVRNHQSAIQHVDEAIRHLTIALANN
jgi:hypothetical protein